MEPPAVVGKAKLIRRPDGLKATAKISGLMPGGVYTFWWVVGDAGYALPDAFVADGGGKVIGSNGKTVVRMNAEVGQPGIHGFLDALVSNAPPTTTDPFHPTFDLDPMTAEVHVEIAYHGQAADAGGDLGDWLSDFWTGDACPTGASGHNPGGTTGAHLELSNPGQPHCPVSYVAVFPGTVIP